MAVDTADSGGHEDRLPHRNVEQGSASIHTGGHDAEFPEAPGNHGISWLWIRDFVSEQGQSYCAVGDPSRQHPCLSVSMVSDLLQCEQVVNH